MHGRKDIMDKKKLHIESQLQIHAGGDDQYQSISYPIYQTATFAHRGFKEQTESTGYDYTRVANPTTRQLELEMALLEGGADAAAFASGMAAVTAVMETFKPGDHFVVDNDLYGGSTRLFQTINTKNGYEFTGIDFSTDDPEQYIRPNTKAFYLETPTNPMMHVTDLEKVSRIAKAHSILLIVDNTFLSPYYQQPIKWGADYVIHSATKYIGGHNDTLGGFVVSATQELGTKIRDMIKITGNELAPIDSWLIIRGLMTLAVRMDRSQENAFRLAEWLQKNPHVTKVLYPGLPDSKGYEIMKKQATGFGGMLTFEVDSAGFAHSILDHVELVRFAESLGGTESLITYPITQTHSEVPKELLDKNGITDRVLRLSVGIENGDDLIEEFERVFAAAEKEN